jgi:tetratricopeptide (TPR) repeat protein
LLEGMMPEKAVDDFTYGLKVTKETDSLRYGILINRGVAYLKFRKFEEAYADLIAVYQYDSLNIMALTNLGAICDEIGRGDETLGYLFKILEIDPTYVPAYANIGYKYQEMGDHHEAIRYYNKVLEMNPKEPLGYSNRAFNLYKTGDYKNALKDINQFILTSIKPSQLIGGFSPRDGLNNSDLNEWLKSLNLSSSGGKEDKIIKLIEYYDNLNMIVESEEDERAKYFHYYEAIATRNIELLRKDGIIKKDLEIERLFEKATNYAFEVMLRHIPQKTVGNERPDGVLLFKDSIIMWDNKSKERPVNLKDHIKQFEGYVARSEKPVIAFIVIGPSFTDESLDVAERFSLTNDTFLSLITAKQFKDLCERWSSRPEKEVFPLNYFRKSGFFNPRIVKF